MRRVARGARKLWFSGGLALRIAAGGAAPRDEPRVCYGHTLPAPGEHAWGGMVKFQRLQEAFPNTPSGFNVLYLGSNTLPRGWQALVRLAGAKGARLVWNQDGVAYPAWHGPGWEKLNAPMGRSLHAADHVFYQSEFCKLSADRFLGELSGSWEILHNAVDTGLFTPGNRERRPLTLLLGGNQYQRYRLETALRTVALLPGARLLVTGELCWLRNRSEAQRVARRLVTELGLADRVGFVGAYRQADAPDLFRSAHILLHTKYNDPCPGVVLEAMACGLPVVYSASGGVPELVGPEAGIGVPTPLSWEEDIPPDPSELAQAVLRVAERLDEYAEAARRRAVERFDLQPWLRRHREVFEGLLA